MKIYTKQIQKDGTIRIEEVNIDQNQCLGQGGQAIVYRQGTYAYKVYDSSKNFMLAEEKINELKKIHSISVITPHGLIYSDKGCRSPVGFYMNAVANTIPLAQFMTKSYKERLAAARPDLDVPKVIVQILQRIRDIIEIVHKSNCCIVDLNENNFLISENLSRIQVFAIDTDNWQTPSFPTQAIMDSIRDRKGKPGVYTPETDWYSFAVISFKMLIGIHPFDGNHELIKNKTKKVNGKDVPWGAPEKMDYRMLNGLSVLTQGARFPKAAVESFTVIPPNWMQWYIDVFHNHKRISAPKTIDVASEYTKPQSVSSAIIGKIRRNAVHKTSKPIVFARVIDDKIFVIDEGKNVTIFDTFKSDDMTYSPMNLQELVYVSDEFTESVPAKDMFVFKSSKGYHVGAFSYKKNILMATRAINMKRDQDPLHPTRTIDTSDKENSFAKMDHQEIGSVKEVFVTRDGTLYARSSSNISNVDYLAGNLEKRHSFPCSTTTRCFINGSAALSIDGLEKDFLFFHGNSKYSVKINEINSHSIDSVQFDTDVAIIISTERIKFEKFISLVTIDVNANQFNGNPKYFITSQKISDKRELPFCVVNANKMAYIQKENELTVIHKEFNSLIANQKYNGQKHKNDNGPTLTNTGMMLFSMNTPTKALGVLGVDRNVVCGIFTV